METDTGSSVEEVAGYLSAASFNLVRQIYNRQVPNTNPDASPTVINLHLWEIRTRLGVWLDSSLSFILTIRHLVVADYKDKLFNSKNMSFRPVSRIAAIGRNVFRNILSPIYQPLIKAWGIDFKQKISSLLPLPAATDDSTIRYLLTLPECRLYQIMENCMKEESSIVTMGLLEAFHLSVQPFISLQMEICQLRSSNFDNLRELLADDPFYFPPTDRTISDCQRDATTALERAVHYVTVFLRLSGIEARVKRLNYKSYFNHQSFECYSNFFQDNMKVLVQFQNQLSVLIQAVSGFSGLFAVQEEGLRQVAREVTALINLLISKASVITDDQPPKTVKKETKLSMLVKMMNVLKILEIPGQSNSSTPPKFVVYVINAEQCKRIQAYQSGHGRFDAEILNNAVPCSIARKKPNSSTCKELPLQSAWELELEKCIVIPERPTTSDPLPVLRQKFYLLFVADVSINNSTCRVMSYSEPFVSTTNVSQDMGAAGTLFWDTVFADPDDAFKVAETITISQFMQGIETHIKMETKCRDRLFNLPAFSKNYLARKVVNADDVNSVLTRTYFESLIKNKPSIKSEKIYFWNWLCESIKVINLFVLEYWKMGIIMFIARDEAESIILEAGPGAFLIRFSDTQQGNLSLMFYENGRAESGLCPPMNSDTLATCIVKNNGFQNICCYDVQTGTKVMKSKFEIFKADPSKWTITGGENRRNYRKGIMTWPAPMTCIAATTSAM